MVKIKTVSAESIDQLKTKLKSGNLTSNNQDRVKLAWLNENKDISLIDEKIDEKRTSDDELLFFAEDDIFFYAGEKVESTAFLFPGQGSQYAGMGKNILNLSDQNIINKADSIFMEFSDYKKPLSYFIHENTDEKILSDTAIAQPAIGLVSALYLNILKKLNITPHVTCGHSFGEISAIYASEAINFETFIKVACMRGKFMSECGQSKDPGTMMAVIGDEKNIQSIITNENLDIIIANRNSPKQNVVSGGTDEIEKARKIFRSHRIKCIKLPVAAAFHSPLVQNAVKPFSLFLDSIEISSPKTDILSNTTGVCHIKDFEQIRESLKKQIISPVYFHNNIETMEKMDVMFFIETGPKKVLTELTKQCLNDRKRPHIIATDASSGKDQISDLAKTIAMAFILGIEPDIERWNRLGQR